MSIIYSYPEQTALNDNDTLLGTSAALVGGKKKNITRNFSLSELSTYFGVGSIINPIASDFKLAVFNQGGTKITDSIISQDALAGTSITIAGNLTANTTTLNGFLTVNGGANLGTGAAGELIAFGSTTRLNAPIQDQLGVVGALDQILISDTAGRVSWQNYTSGLTYTGTWDAANNITAPQGVPLVSSIGTNGEFYIVTVAGNTQLNGQPVTPTTPPYWNVGDWVVFVENGAAGVWQKIDNTSVLTGTGTDNKIAMWTGGATPSVTLTDSLISQDAGAATVTVAGSLTSTGNISGVNITGTGNLSGDNLLLTGTVSLNAQLGNPGQVLTSQGTADAIWANPTPVNNITGSGTANTLSMFTGQYTVGDSIVTQDAGGTIVTTAGNSSITGYIQPATLQDAGASPGTAGQVLTSTGTALDWVDANTVGDTYTISSTTTPGANRVPIDLTAASGAGASSILNLVEGSGITLTQTSSTEITIASTSTSVVNSLQQISGTNVSTTALDLTGTASGGVLIGNITIALNEFGGGNFIGTVPSASGVTNVGFLDYTGNWSDAVVSVLASTSTPINNSIGAQSIQAFTNVAGAVEINSYKFNGNGKPGAVVSTSSANDNLYLKGDGSWASVPAQGVTSVSGDATTIAATAGNTPVISAITTGGVGTGLANLATGGQIKSAIDAALIGFLEFKGGFNATTGVIDGGTDNLTVGAARVAVEIGDFYIVTTAGNFYGDATEPLAIGDQVIAITAYLVGQSVIAGWVKVQQNIGVATDTVQGIANFPTGNNGLNISSGAVTAKLFSGGTPGYVPDATSAPTGTFLKEDGTWAVAGTGTVTSVGLSTNVAALTVTNTPVTGSGTLTLNRNGGTTGQYIDGASGAWTDLPAPGTGTVTDVGLTMPAAFSVTPSSITSSGNLAVTPTGGSAGQFLDYTGNWSSPGGGVSSVSFSNTISPSAGPALTITPTTGSVVVSANVFGGNGMHGIVSSGSSGNDALFLKGDGSWDTPGGASATITSNQTTTTNATTTVFALGATPNGSSVNFVDAFIDGVYQETTTYSVSGQNLTFNDPVPSGVTVETKTTADYNVGAVVTTASLGQANTTGNVNLRIIPNYITSSITAQANNLYIFDSTTQAYTLTLPSSPQPGDSIKISIRGGLATNTLAVPATENIMGGVLGVSLVINNATAAFEIIYSGDSTKQGWVIIGNV
jgi:hypothetical protein